MAPFIIHPVDLSGSEAAQRERAALLQDAQLLLADPSALALLKTMANAVASDSAKVWSLAQGGLSEPLQRLLHSGQEVRKALAGQVPPHLDAELGAVRSALDRRMERAVLSAEKADSASPDVQAALRCVRLGRMGKCRLLHLIDAVDSSTNEDPLRGFEGCSGDGMAEFAQASLVLALAWAMAWPPHAALVYQFVHKLSKVVGERRAKGVPWATLSTYYFGLMRKVDAGASRYALREEHGTFRTAPNLEWIDGRYSYVQTLTEESLDARMRNMVSLDRASAQAEADAASRLAAANGDLGKARELAKAAKRALKQKGARQRKAARKAAGKSGQLAAQAQAQAVAANLTAAAGLEAPSTSRAMVPYDSSKAAESQSRIEARVAAAHPSINGRKPCSFFFGPQKSCRFDAATCTNGHHGQ